MTGYIKKAIMCLMASSVIIAAGKNVSDVKAAGKKVSSIKLNVSSKTLKEGQKYTLKVKSVKPAGASKAVIWKTSDKKKVTVNNKGVITAKKKGTATITAVSKSNKKKKAVCTVIVKSKSSIRYSGKYSGTVWTIDNEGLLTVRGSGEIYNRDAAKPGPGWMKYCSYIKSANINLKKVTNLKDLFHGCNKLVKVNLSKLNTSEVTDMSSMFYGCSKLTSINVSKFNTSKVTDMNYMFYGCSKLKSVDVSRFDTSNVVNMSNMFSKCKNLSKIDVSKFNTYNTKDMSYIFSGCEKIKILNLYSFDTSNVKNMVYMFEGCKNIKKLDMRTFDISMADSLYGMFYGCQNLDTIITPRKTSGLVPELPDGQWSGSDGNKYTNMPEYLEESMILLKYI